MDVVTETSTPTPTSDGAPSATPTITETFAPGPSDTPTPTSTTPTATPTETLTPTPTTTGTQPTPTDTATGTVTLTPTQTGVLATPTPVCEDLIENGGFETQDGNVERQRRVGQRHSVSSSMGPDDHERKRPAPYIVGRRPAACTKPDVYSSRPESRTSMMLVVGLEPRSTRKLGTGLGEALGTTLVTRLFSSIVTSWVRPLGFLCHQHLAVFDRPH